jgi:Amt family ammonium transporter
MDSLKAGSDVLFILLGAIMVLAMHAGFAFLELGTVRKKNQVNALVKILVDFAVSTIAYFFIGYSIAYGVNFFSGAELLAEKNGYELVKFFFLLTFAAAIPAIISGGIAERAKFNPQLIATFILVGFSIISPPTLSQAYIKSIQYFLKHKKNKIVKGNRFKTIWAPSGLFSIDKKSAI